MRRLSRLLATGLLVLTPVPARADEPALRICTTGDYRPLTYLDPATGRYAGADIDMARDLAATLARPPVFVATTWPTLIRDLSTPGTCDIAMGGISITPAREKIGEFTQPYLSSGKVAITATAAADRFTTIESINQPGVRVIENPGGTNEAFAREHLPLAVLTIWPDNTTIFDELAARHADVDPDHPFTHDEKAYLLPAGSPLSAAVAGWLRQRLDDGTFTRFYDLAMT
jgi:cyclohexadienyl dehydratase